ncbi:hypothetical protein PG997_007245, partial [Apiospora hydei]
MASKVIVFGPTGQVGSAVARTAAECGAEVWLAMRTTSKSIPGLSKEQEAKGPFHRVQADLQDPATVTEAVKKSGAKRAFIYLVHGAQDHLQGAITAMKAAGVEFVVFLSSFTILIEANLDDAFGPGGYVAVRPGCFMTNLLSEKAGIAAGHVELYGGSFEQDNIHPSDVGRVIGNILVSGPRHGHKNIVYLYGPEVRSLHESVARIGEALGKADLTITPVGPTEGYDNYIKLGMPPPYAQFMVDCLSTAGPDKGDGSRFPNYEEGVRNVQLYAGKPATTLEDWVTENKAIFAG